MIKILLVALAALTLTGCGSKKYDNWSECFSEEIKESGDYKLSLFYCNSNYEKNDDENLELSAEGLNGGGKTINVRMPNGQIINNVPKDTTKKELLKVLKASGYNTDALLDEKDPAVTSNSDGSLEYQR